MDKLLKRAADKPKRLMRVTYDPEANAAYIYLVEIGPGEAEMTVSLDELGEEVGALHSINLDFNRAGELIGVEVLNASATLPEAVLATAETLS